MIECFRFKWCNSALQANVVCVQCVCVCVCVCVCEHVWYVCVLCSIICIQQQVTDSYDSNLFDQYNTGIVGPRS